MLKWNPSFINCKRKVFNNQSFWKKPKRRLMKIFNLLKSKEWNQDQWVQQSSPRTTHVLFLWVHSKFLFIKSVERKVQRSYLTSIKISIELIGKLGRNGNRVDKVEFQSNRIISDLIFHQSQVWLMTQIQVLWVINFNLR